MFHYNSMNQSEKNISRLVKLADDSNKPRRAFTEPLTDAAISELRWLGPDKKQEKTAAIPKVGWWEKTPGWAAMVAAACGAWLTIVVSTLLKINFFLEAIVVLTIFFNWLTFLGGRIL